MNILTYYMPGLKHRACWYDIPRMLEMLADTAQRAAPGCRLILLSDIKIDPWEQAPARGDDMMSDRLQAFIDVMEPGEQYLCLDADTLVNRDPTPLFDDDYDLGLCQYDPKGKVNAGVMYVRNVEVAREVFSEVKEMYLQDGRGQIEWPLRKLLLGGRAGLKSLPCALANWRPEVGDTPKDGEHAYIWHFVGLRKDEMPRYYEELTC